MVEKHFSERPKRQLEIDHLIDDFPDETIGNPEDLYEFAMSDEVLNAAMQYALILAKKLYKLSNKIERFREIQHDVYIEYRESIERYCHITNHNSMIRSRKEFLIYVKGSIRGMVRSKASKAQRENTAVTNALPNATERRLGVRPKVITIGTDLKGEFVDGLIEPFLDALTVDADPTLSPEQRLVALEEVEKTTKIAKDLLHKIIARELELDEATTKAALEFLILGFPENGGNYGRKGEVAEMYGVTVGQLDNRLDGMKERAQRHLGIWLDR